MQYAFGMSVPETVTEMCRAGVVAVLVYDAQIGILERVLDRDGLIGRIRSVLGAARTAGAPVLYVRHTSVPPERMGVAALRTAMARQKVARPEEIRQEFPPEAAHTQIVPELAPVADEPVFDKLGRSALIGTPVESVLHDWGITTVALVGAVLETGIEATARHAADAGFLPLVVRDACGMRDAYAARRAESSLEYTGMCHRCESADLVATLGSRRRPPGGWANHKPAASLPSRITLRWTSAAHTGDS